MTRTRQFDVVIKGATVFDGRGSRPVIQDVAIADGTIADRGPNIPPGSATEVIDATGKWLMPGLLDIHTHLDLEVEVSPGLPEAVRHGTTTVVVGNCSLGAAFGPQYENGESSIVDCFTRVESMPKSVLRKCVDKMTWDNTADYLAHFEHLPLGPNIAPLIPHSMLRIAVMGITDAIRRAPSRAEHRRMQDLLETALLQGYLGMSTDNLVFHYLANDPHKHCRIPTQFADDRELKPLMALLRRHDRVWQATPDTEDLFKSIRRFLWTSARLHGKPLRISALSMLDFKPLPHAWKHVARLARLLNSRLVGGQIHFQVLTSRFKIWSDGVLSPILEELEPTRELIACEREDREGRRAILQDPDFRRRFKADWKRLNENFRWFPKPTGTFQLLPSQMHIDRCPVAAWQGKTLAEVFERVQRYQRSEASVAPDSEEAAALARVPGDTRGADDLFLHCLVEYDLAFRWWMDLANVDPDVVKQILFNDHTLPGFNDSGAHIMNIAFYDSNLVTLQLAQQDGLDRVAVAVRKLTRDPAQFFGIDAGGIEIGDRADVTVIDPEALRVYDNDRNRQFIHHPIFETEVLVNRSDGVVDQVYIRGVRVWERGCAFTPALGSQTLGQALTFAGRSE